MPAWPRLTDEGYRQHLVYQPRNHFWRLQWAETGALPRRLGPACRALVLVDAPPAVLTATDPLYWLSRGRAAGLALPS